MTLGLIVLLILFSVILVRLEQNCDFTPLEAQMEIQAENLYEATSFLSKELHIVRQLLDSIDAKTPNYT